MAIMAYKKHQQRHCVIRRLKKPPFFPAFLKGMPFDLHQSNKQKNYNYDTRKNLSRKQEFD